MENFLNITPVGFEIAMQEAIELPASMEIAHLNAGGTVTSSNKTPNYALLIISMIVGGIISYIVIDIYQKNKRVFVAKDNKDLKQ